MRTAQSLHRNEGSATTHGADGVLTRRELMGGAALGAALLGPGAPPLVANTPRLRLLPGQSDRGGVLSTATFTFGSFPVMHRP